MGVDGDGAFPSDSVPIVATLEALPGAIGGSVCSLPDECRLLGRSVCVVTYRCMSGARHALSSGSLPMVHRRSTVHACPFSVVIVLRSRTTLV